MIMQLTNCGDFDEYLKQTQRKSLLHRCALAIQLVANDIQKHLLQRRLAQGISVDLRAQHTYASAHSSRFLRAHGPRVTEALQDAMAQSGTN